MKILVVALALVTSVLHHYAFSFQRFTLIVARKHAETTAGAHELQLLMTSTMMGLVGWLSTLLLLAAAVSLGVMFAWWWGLIFLVADLLVMGRLMPLFPLRTHFASLSRRELGRHMLGPNSSLAARLMIDVIRSGAGQPI